MTKQPLLISACLLGVRCRYDGACKACAHASALAQQYQLIPICPEQLGGLPTPRTPAERRGEHVFTKDGRDVTAEYQRGAEEALSDPEDSAASAVSPERFMFRASAARARMDHTPEAVTTSMSPRRSVSSRAVSARLLT